MSSIKLNEYRSSKTVISGFSFYQTNTLDYLHDTFDNEELTNSMSFISNSSLL